QLAYTCACKYLTPLVIAYASTFRTRRRCSLRSDRGEGGAERARVAGLERTAQGPRHALAPARDRSRRQDRSGPGRLRRARSAGGCWWFAADDRAGGPGPHLTLWHDPTDRPARSR